MAVLAGHLHERDEVSVAKHWWMAIIISWDGNTTADMWLPHAEWPLGLMLLISAVGTQPSC